MPNLSSLIRPSNTHVHYASRHNLLVSVPLLVITPLLPANPQSRMRIAMRIQRTLSHRVQADAAQH
jgi:hypothetical protein